MDAVLSLKALKPIHTKRENGGMLPFNGEKEEPLSPMARLFHEPGSNVYIITIFGWKTQVNSDLLKANLVHALLKHPRFSSLQVVDKDRGGEIKWVKTEVDLDKHINTPAVDPNMDISAADKFVEDYISNLTKTTIDMSKPMWDCHHLSIKTSHAHAVSVLRVHHSLGDGTSLAAFLLDCILKSSDPPQALQPMALSVTKKSNPINNYFTRFWSALLLVWNTIIDVFMFVATALFLKDTETPLKDPPDVEFSPRRIIHRTVSLDDIKLVKNGMNTTVNDVVVGVAQAGLSRYLNRRYGDIKKDDGCVRKKNYLPKNIFFRAILYFNFRSFLGNHATVDTREKSSEVRLGNKIGYVLFPFTIAFRDNPLDYVRESKATMDRKKASHEAIYTYFLAKTFLNFFGSKALGIISHKVFSRTAMWFSNVRGPREEVSFCGHPIAYIASTCYGQPNALMIHVISYVNKMIFVLSADEATIPDPHQLCDDLEESLKLIKDAVLEKGRIKHA